MYKNVIIKLSVWTVNVKMICVNKTKVLIILYCICDFDKSIYKFSLSVRLSVCLFASNKRYFLSWNPRTFFFNVHKENMFTIELENGREASWKSSSYTLLVCLFVSLINVKTAVLIGPKFFVGPHVTQGRYMDDQMIKNLPLTKFDFWKIFKSTNFFWKSTNYLFCFVFVLQHLQKEHIHNWNRRWAQSVLKA